MADNNVPTFSWEQETSSYPSQNQVAPSTHYVGATGTQYGMSTNPVAQPQQRHMPPPIPRDMAIALHPYGSPHFYDDNGKGKEGIIKWTPDPSEGPYRPCYAARDKAFGTVTIRCEVEAMDDTELEEEINKSMKDACCSVFCCYFYSALKAVSLMKKSRELKNKGNDIGARNTLLDAKVQLFYSSFIGLIIWCSVWGITHLLVFPVVAIIYLCIKK